MIRSADITKSGTEPAFQIILIASALLHILAIATITSPFMKNERIEERYFVKLVTPSKPVQETKQKPKSETVKQAKPVVSVKQVKKPEPVKKVQKKKSVSESIQTIKKKSVKKRFQADKKYADAVPPLAESKHAARHDITIKRKAPRQKRERVRSFSTNRQDRGSTFMAKAGSLDNMGVITGKEVAKKNEHEQIEKGVREQSFNLKRNYNDDQHRITRSSREEENSNLPLEKAHRDSLYEEEETESVDENQYAIARPQVPVMNEAVRDLPDEDPVDYPGTDFTNVSSFSEITGDDGAPAIERPAVQGMPEKREMMQDRQKEELLKKTDLADENKNDNINDPDLMITGVPLDELNACTDALDERMLKKKILNVIGKNMGCYRKGMGEFLFMGTSRFASFDMKVRPQGGRKLANRCEELKNAYYCLTSERNN